MNDGKLKDAPKHEESSVDSLETGSEIIAFMQILRRKRRELANVLGNHYLYDFLRPVADFINAVEDLEKAGKSGLNEHFFKRIVSYPALLSSREFHRGLSRELVKELKGLSDKHQSGIEICDELNFKVRECKPISDDEFNTALEGYKKLARDIEKAVSSEIDRLRQTETE